MSHVFTDGNFLPASGPPGFSYRTYAKLSSIVLPTKTFVFLDEHPDTINDADFAVKITPGDAANGVIVDFPASFHGNAAGFSFADGHAEIHRWIGSKIQPQVNGVYMNQGQGVPAGDSLNDVKWLSDNTTVKN